MKRLTIWSGILKDPFLCTGDHDVWGVETTDTWFILEVPVGLVLTERAPICVVGVKMYSSQVIRAVALWSCDDNNVMQRVL